MTFKRLGMCSIVCGLLVGQTFNGPTTMRLGVYLITLALVLLVVSALVPRSSR